MFPLSTVLLPGELLPLHVFEPRYRAMVADRLATKQMRFGVVLIARGSEVGGGDTRTDVGTLAHIEALSATDDGRYGLLARGARRLVVRRWMADDPYPRASIALIEDPPVDDGAARSAADRALRHVEALVSELGRAPAPDPAGRNEGEGVGPKSPEQDETEEMEESEAARWELCARLSLGPLDRQRLLSTDDPVSRLALLAELAEAQAEDLRRLLAGG